MGESVAFLILFWFLFFRRFFFNPWSCATADLFSTYFSHWRHLGRTRATYDKFHFGHAEGLPFTCVWYPLHWVTAVVGRFLPLDASFLFYTGYLISHYLFASICWYLVFGNLLLAITMTYAMRFISCCQSIAISWGWLSFTAWALASGHPVTGAVGLYLAVSGGYWPLIIYVLPVLGAVYWGPSLIPLVCTAAVLCLPQAWVTWRYMQGSVRTESTYESRSIGSVPPWHWISLLWPLRLNLNGVLYPELSYGIGRIGLVIGLWGLVFATEWPLAALSLVGVYLAMGRYVRAPVIGRIPARATWMVSMALTYSCIPIVHTLSPELYTVLLLLQSWDILINHAHLFLYEPFMEPGGKPSRQLDNVLIEYLKDRKGRVSGLPHPWFAGHLTGIKGLGYSGGCMLKESALARRVTNPNGDALGQDWFSSAEDGQALDDYGIRYAYRPPELDQSRWQPTDIPDLWHRRD